VNTKTGTVRAYAGVMALAALAALFASLGNWQLERAEESRETQARFADGAKDAVLTRLPASLDERERFRRVEVRGEYVGEPQFLLDNMLHDGVAGYHVLTALRVDGARARLLVNRGWLPTGADRRVLPDVTVAGGARTIRGRLERLPRPGLVLGAADSSTAAAPVAVLQFPTAEELAHRLGAPVLDYQVLLDPAADDGYVRQWRAPGVAPERNLLYAGQWWLLAAGALAAAIAVAVKTARRKP
jgi:surfeit locus 1 family protein